jgi:hypothetical protein
MELLGTWRSLYTLRYGPLIMGQLLSSAGSIFFHSALLAASGARVGDVSLRHSLSQMSLCLQYLQEVGRSYQCARTVASILHSLLQKRLNPILVTRSQEPGPILPQIDSTANPQMPPTSSQQVSPPKPSYANGVFIPPLHGTQSSGFYNTSHVQSHPHVQAAYSQHRSPVYPGPAHPTMENGPLPMGNQMTGTEGWSSGRFMPLDMEDYQSQLGLPQLGEHEILARGPFTDEEQETFQQYILNTQQYFDGSG